MDGSDDMEYYTGQAPDMGVFEIDGGECGITGDVNTDGSVNILDIIRIVNIILENYIPDMFEYQLADFNNDNNINVLDIIGIVNIILES